MRCKNCEGELPGLVWPAGCLVLDVNTNQVANFSVAN